MFNDSFAVIQSPCYDKKLKKDCPRRCAGCADNCPEWAAYVAERDELYKKRKVETAGVAPLYGGAIRNETKKLRRKIRDSRYTKTGYGR